MSEQTTSQRRKMIDDLFRAIDAKDVDGLLAHLAPEATQRFGNQETLHGHEQIRAANEGFFGAIDSLRHEVTGFWEWDDTIVVRLDASYTRLDGLTVTVPAASILRVPDDLIVEYQVFADMTPVFAPAEASR
jgi:ketosteroid isomerase-like protein